MVFEVVIVIRVFQISDLSALEDLYLQARRSTFQWVDPERFQHEDFVRDTDGEAIFVADINGRPVGFVSVWTSDHFVHHLYVLADARRQGVGTILLQRARELAEAAGADALRLNCAEGNVNACVFYERQGWIVESTAIDELTGPHRNYLLRLPSSIGFS